MNTKTTTPSTNPHLLAMLRAQEAVREARRRKAGHIAAFARFVALAGVSVILIAFMVGLAFGVWT